MNRNVAYLVGVLQGDGTVRAWRNRHGVLSAYYVSIAVGEDDKDYVEIVRDAIRQAFSYDARVYKQKRTYRVVISKRFIVGCLEKFKKNMELPIIIEKSDTKTKAAYIRGLFDTDGGCFICSRFKTGKIDFSNKQKVLVCQIKNILEKDFGIWSNVRVCKKGGYDPVFRLFITNKINITAFSKTIGFNHPRKKKKLKELLKVYEKVDERSIRGTMQNTILGLLKTRKNLTTNEVSKLLKRHRETVKEHLERMEKAGLIEKRVVYFNRWGEIPYSRFRKFQWNHKPR